MILEILKSSGFFTETSLKRWEFLFHEWDQNERLYVIYDGELSIQRSISTSPWEFKTLWLLGVGNIVGEWALSNKNPKEVQVLAKRDTILLSINAKNDFPIFLQKFPEEWYKLLISIIDIANTRLLRANRELTANYEVSQAISHIEKIDTQAICKLLETFSSILQVEQILYFERNRVMPDYYKLKYDSNNSHKFQNKIFKFQNNTLFLEPLKDENITILPFFKYTPLLLWQENHGFLLISRNKKDFSENEEKLLSNIATSFVWVIHQKEILDDERDRLSLK